VRRRRAPGPGSRRRHAPGPGTRRRCAPGPGPRMAGCNGDAMVSREIAERERAQG
jgi:hypothetical protein